MSLEDRKVQYIIEAIDESEKGMKSATLNMDKLTQKAFALNQAFEATKNIGGMVAKTFMALYNPASAIAEAAERQALMLGVSTKEMQKWNFVATQNKTSTEAVTFAFTQLTMKAYEAFSGNKEATKSFKDLGVSVVDASGQLRTNEQIINDTIKSLSSISSESKRAALAQDIFGRSGKELLPMLSQGTQGINNQRDAAEKLGQVLSDRAVKSFTETNDSLDRMKTSLAVAGGELLTTFLPTLQKVVDKATQAASALSKAFKTPTEMEYFSEKLTQLRSERDALFSSGSRPSDTKLEMLQDEIMFYERKYNMLLALSKISDKDKGSATESGIVTPSSASSGAKGKKPDDDYDLYKEALYKNAQDRFEARKKAEDLIREYTKASGESILNDAAEKGEKYRALEAALADSKINTITDQYERELSELDLWKQREIALYEDVSNSKTMIDEMYDAKKKAIEEAAAKRSADLTKREKDMKISAFGEVAMAFSGLMGAIGEASKENARAQKAIAIVQAIINTAVGATKALSATPYPPVNAVLMAATIAMGAVQIATIASQNFALGGVAKRNPGAVSDSVNINVNPDERIVTKRQQNNLTRFLNNPEGGSRGDTYNIYDTSGDLVETLVTKIRNGAGDKLINVLNSRYALT
jgi:hypothetical protein